MLQEIGKKAKAASIELAKLSSKDKNNILEKIGVVIDRNRKNIIEENQKDIISGKENNLSAALLDRLLLTEDRIDGMLESIKQTIDLKDPVGEIFSMDTMPNDLIIGKKSVPFGVIGIIYESRPNVTLDCSLLCLKSSNALILKGGKEAINSNIAIEESIREAIEEAGFNPDFVQLIKDNDREVTTQFMKLNKYVDVLIPRGSGRLINSVVENATVPVIKTGEGNCHVFVDETADIEMALRIVENSKTQRTGVCNAMESLLVHKNVGEEFYAGLRKVIKDHDVKVHACRESLEYIPELMEATEEDFGLEYLDMEFSMKVVEDIDEAINHIQRYSTGHSEAIVTKDYFNSQRFLNEVDAACVYVNASTRFTDGGEFGMGAEMGISTQKLHVRGPIGLKELTSYKYIIYGEGQTR